MQSSMVKKLSRAGIIAALYTAVSLLVFPLAGGSIQLRVSEAFTLLPLFFIESVPALFIGCILSNLIVGCAPPDIFFGSLVTLIAAVLTYGAGRLIKNLTLKIIVGGLFPVLLNAFLLPLIWVYCYGALEYIYIIQALILILGQSLAVYAVGTPLVISLNRLKKSGAKFLE